MTLPLLALALLVLGSLLATKLLARQRDLSSRTDLRFVATNPWMLEQFCTSLGTVLREWPELRKVSVDVNALTVFDDATVASLKGALATATRSRVELKVQGHTGGMARAAIARGMDVACFGTPRATPTLDHVLH